MNPFQNTTLIEFGEIAANAGIRRVKLAAQGLQINKLLRLEQLQYAQMPSGGLHWR